MGFSFLITNCSTAGLGKLEDKTIFYYEINIKGPCTGTCTWDVYLKWLWNVCMAH